MVLLMILFGNLVKSLFGNLVKVLLLDFQTACLEIWKLFGGQTDRQTKRLVEAPSPILKTKALYFCSK